MDQPKDYSDAVDRAAVDARFDSVRPPAGDQAVRIDSLRSSARLLARHVLRVCPPSPERDRALLDIDSVLSFAALAILRHE